MPRPSRWWSMPCATEVRRPDRAPMIGSETDFRAGADRAEANSYRLAARNGVGGVASTSGTSSGKPANIRSARRPPSAWWTWTPDAFDSRQCLSDAAAWPAPSTLTSETSKILPLNSFASQPVRSWFRGSWWSSDMALLRPTDAEAGWPGACPPRGCRLQIEGGVARGFASPDDASPEDMCASSVLGEGRSGSGATRRPVARKRIFASAISEACCFPPPQRGEGRTSFNQSSRSLHTGTRRTRRGRGGRPAPGGTGRLPRRAARAG